MESLVRVLRDLIRAFRYYRFYIFSKELYSSVVTIVRESGLSGLVRIRPLGSNRQYFILELDFRNYIARCREVCTGNDGLINNECFIRCREESMDKLYNDVINKLENFMKNVSVGG